MGEEEGIEIEEEMEDENGEEGWAEVEEAESEGSEKGAEAEQSELAVSHKIVSPPCSPRAAAAPATPPATTRRHHARLLPRRSPCPRSLGARLRHESSLASRLAERER